jgi:hypothetical protein
VLVRSGKYCRDDNSGFRGVGLDGEGG